MPFQKGNKLTPKANGRVYKSKNKKTLAKEALKTEILRERAKKEIGQELGYNDFLSISEQKEIVTTLLRVATDDGNPKQISAAIALLDRYLPKRTATDLTSKGESVMPNIVFQMNIGANANANNAVYNEEENPDYTQFVANEHQERITNQSEPDT